MAIKDSDYIIAHHGVFAFIDQRYIKPDAHHFVSGILTPTILRLNTSYKAEVN